MCTPAGRSIIDANETFTDILQRTLSQPASHIPAILANNLFCLATQVRLSHCLIVVIQCRSGQQNQPTARDIMKYVQADGGGYSCALTAPSPRAQLPAAENKLRMRASRRGRNVHYGGWVWRPPGWSNQLGVILVVDRWRAAQPLQDGKPERVYNLVQDYTGPTGLNKVNTG